MSAQSGDAIVLVYGPQGVQQAGDSLVLSYSPPVQARRTLSVGLSAPWGAAHARAHEIRAPYVPTRAVNHRHHAPWGKYTQRPAAEPRAPWGVARAVDTTRRAPWGKFAKHLVAERSAPWGVARALDIERSAPWGSYGLRLALAVQLPWNEARRLDIEAQALWGKFARRPEADRQAPWATPRRVDAERWLPWTRFSKQLAPGWGVVVPDGNPPTDEFGTVLVPVRRVSIVINTITLHRVDTGAQLRAHAFNASLDFGSWTWSWSASLHHDAEGLLGRDSAGDTAELHTVINGVPLRLRLESVELDERFLPQKRWAVSGQGKSSILGDSRAPILSFGNAVDRTAQQLAADALTINGVGIGWSLDWGIADWLVPAGAWALQGRYIDAINDIAAAAGGYVQPHPTDAVLRVLPLYPLPPWEWGSVTPDFEIPRGAAEVVGTKFVDKPAYNGVYVGGESVGVFGPFKRTGTDGAVLAPQVNHALITHADAHRARGIAEISDTGAQEHVTLSMQVLPETGLVVPGQFVRYVGDRTVVGIVRRTSIDLNRPKLRQTIAIETHVAD